MNTSPEQPFSSPQEEIAWLRDQLETKTKNEGREPTPRKEAAKEMLYEAIEKAPKPLGTYALTDDDTHKKTKAIKEEEHHEQIGELMAIAEEKGILSALKVARGLNNPHLLDDFHDHLIETLLFHDNAESSS